MYRGACARAIMIDRVLFFSDGTRKSKDTVLGYRVAVEDAVFYIIFFARAQRLLPEKLL